MLGRLKSLPWTFAGAMGLGLAQSYAVGYLPSDGNLAGPQERDRGRASIGTRAC